MPADWHLALGSPLIDTGDPSLSDPDGTRSDIGSYGGEDGGDTDLDHDGYDDYFWPGTIADAPEGFSSADYDANDQDPAVH